MNDDDDVLGWAMFFAIYFGIPILLVITGWALAYLGRHGWGDGWQVVGCILNLLAVVAMMINDRV